MNLKTHCKLHHKGRISQELPKELLGKKLCCYWCEFEFTGGGSQLYRHMKENHLYLMREEKDADGPNDLNWLFYRRAGDLVRCLRCTLLFTTGQEMVHHLRKAHPTYPTEEEYKRD